MRQLLPALLLAALLPLHAGASSRIFLAWLPSDEQDRYLSAGPLATVTDKTLTDPSRVRNELRHIRETGYAKSVGETDPGTVAVAAPIFDRDGLTAVMTVCGPRERFEKNLDAAAVKLMELASKVSSKLGHR